MLRALGSVQFGQQRWRLREVTPLYMNGRQRSFPKDKKKREREREKDRKKEFIKPLILKMVYHMKSDKLKKAIVFVTSNTNGICGGKQLN